MLIRQTPDNITATSNQYNSNKYVFVCRNALYMLFNSYDMLMPENKSV